MDYPESKNGKIPTQIERYRTDYFCQSLVAVADLFGINCGSRHLCL